MSGASFDFRLDGDEELLAALDQFIRRAQNLSVVYADIGEHLLLTHRERWDRQESPDGTPWQPLSQAYITSKRKRESRGRNKILVLDEFLRGGLRYQASHAGLSFGTDSVYGATHQFGRGAIPARPFLGLDNEDETYILEAISDFLSGTK